MPQQRAFTNEDLLAMFMAVLHKHGEPLLDMQGNLAKGFKLSAADIGAVSNMQVVAQSTAPGVIEIGVIDRVRTYKENQNAGRSRQGNDAGNPEGAAQDAEHPGQACFPDCIHG